jgi:hypothetical protein
MERFRRLNPVTHRPVEVQLFDPVLSGERLDDYREVRLVFEDGRRYQAGFWRDPQERGCHWWEEPGMVIVPDLTTGHVMAAVDDILDRAAVADAFELLPEG